MLPPATKDSCACPLAQRQYLENADVFARFLGDLLGLLCSAPEDEQQRDIYRALLTQTQDRYVNYNHFSRTHRKVRYGSRPAIDRSDVVRAWLRQEAIMTATNSEDLDFWIPTYSGSPTAPLDLTKFSFLACQVKNRDRTGGVTPFGPTLLAGDLTAGPRDAVIVVPKAQQSDSPISLWFDLGSSASATPSPSAASSIRVVRIKTAIGSNCALTWYLFDSVNITNIFHYHHYN